MYETRGEGKVKKREIFADILYGSPLNLFSSWELTYLLTSENILQFGRLC